MRLIFIDLGYRQIYTVGVYNGTVSELSETYRYYPSTDCSDSPAMIVTRICIGVYYCRYDVEKNSTETDYTESE